jgi:hypothetical protein
MSNVLSFEESGRRVRILRETREIEIQARELLTELSRLRSIAETVVQASPATQSSAEREAWSSLEARLRQDLSTLKNLNRS